MSEKEFIERTNNISDRLYRMAYLYLGNEADSLEAVDEGVYKALKGLKKLRDEQFYETWITRIVINECNKELRRRKKTSFEELNEEIAVEYFDSLPLKDAISSLPENLRSVVILRFFLDYSLADVAKSLDIPEGTVSTWQRKALSLLKLELEDYNE